MRAAASVAVLVVCCAASVAAQSTAPQGLIEGSAAWATNDAQRPERFNYEIERAVYAIGAAIFVAPRLALGGDWVRLGKVTAPGGTSRNQIEEEHREHAWLGTVRVRPVRTATGAVDVVFGAGVVRQSRATAFIGNSAADRTMDSASPAFSARIELPIALAKHLSIAPSLGLYFLRRDEVTESAVNLSRTRPSTRGAFGVGGMLIW